MYCSSCGSSISQELNYCNRCGAKTGKEGTAGRPFNPLPFILAALCVIDVAALLIFAALMMVFLDRHVDDKVIAAISSVYLVMLAMINFIFLRLVSRLVGLHIESKSADRETAPAGLSAHTTAQLQAPRQQPLTSVTDHTTRILDEVLIKER
jgi:hypothetical protein